MKYANITCRFKNEEG